MCLDSCFLRRDLDSPLRKWGHLKLSRFYFSKSLYKTQAILPFEKNPIFIS